MSRRTRHPWVSTIGIEVSGHGWMFSCGWGAVFGVPSGNYSQRHSHSWVTSEPWRFCGHEITARHKILIAMLKSVSHCSSITFALVRLVVFVDGWHTSLREGGISGIHGSICHDNDHHLWSLCQDQQSLPQACVRESHCSTGHREAGCKKSENQDKTTGRQEKKRETAIRRTRFDDHGYATLGAWTVANCGPLDKVDSI